MSDSKVESVVVKAVLSAEASNVIGPGGVDVRIPDPVLGSVRVTIAPAEQRLSVRLEFAWLRADAETLRAACSRLISNLQDALGLAFFYLEQDGQLEDNLDELRKVHEVAQRATAAVGHVVSAGSIAMPSFANSGVAHVANSLRFDHDAAAGVSKAIQSVAKNDGWAGALRAVDRTTDPVAKFVLLYGVVLTLTGGQAAADGLLLKLEPTLPISPSPRNPGVQETVFTRLRNELVHPEDRQQPIEQLVPEIQRNVERLRDLVARAIRERL